jgi:hypothetical protein
MDKDMTPEERRAQDRMQDRVRSLAGKVAGPDDGEVDEAAVRDLEQQMTEREVRQRDAMDAMRGQGAVRRDGRVTPDVPDHLNNPDATVEDRLKDLERRANTADAVDEDLRRAARGERDAAEHSEPGSRPMDSGEAADAADALHGPQSEAMPLDPANKRLDPQPAVEQPDAPKAEQHPEGAFGAPVTAKDKNATATAKEKADAAKAREQRDAKKE